MERTRNSVFAGKKQEKIYYGGTEKNQKTFATDERGWTQIRKKI
jgi:hypothetical protein